MGAYRLYTVVPYLVKFIDSLTNVYVRYNRKRLKGAKVRDVSGKHRGERAMHRVCVRVSMCVYVYLCPMTSGEVYRRPQLFTSAPCAPC